MTRDWLLTVEVGGAVLRFATQTRDAGGETWRGELEPDLEVSLGTVDDVSVRVLSRLLDGWVDDLDTATARLEFLDADGSIALATSGIVTAPVYGAPGEPVAFTISRDAAGDTRGTQVPAESARVDGSTWPAQTGTEGATYPVIFGYPGFIGSGVNPIPCVPLPIAELGATTTTTYLLVSEDPTANITSVRVRLLDDHSEYDQTTAFRTDALGQRVIVADCSTGGIGSMPDAGTSGLLVGFAPFGGGGVARGLWDCIRYALGRWGASSVDWNRLADARAILEPLLVDSYVVSPVEDPWVLIEDWLTWLPIEIRVGRHGRYLVRRRYTHDPARVVGELRNAARSGSVSRDGPPQNEVGLQIRHDPEIGYRDQVLVVGSRTALRPADTDLDTERVIETAVARASFARYGRRPGQRIALDWTWDLGTALAIGQHVLERRALPARMVSYTVSPSTGSRWQQGDELLVTDDELGWSEVPAIIDAPPGISLDRVSLLLRVPVQL